MSNNAHSLLVLEVECGTHDVCVSQRVFVLGAWLGCDIGPALGGADIRLFIA